MNKIDPKSWMQYMEAFHEKTESFYNGTLSKNEYKGFSGLYGSYAQKSGDASMLRLRMTAGVVTKEKFLYIADKVRQHKVDLMKFTTCQTIQLHNLKPAAIFDIMEGALSVGIVTMGGGGDFPRNVMCSPLTGVEEGEYFNVRPYAEAAADYLMNFVMAEKMPRKLKVCFSNTPENVTHATYRDLGFAANADGTFDVYSAGGLGNNPKFGVKVAEGIAPEKILYYIKAMWLTFRAYGNYENRGKARTRYMQEICGGADKYKEAYLEKLAEVMNSGEDLDLQVEPCQVTKKGCGTICGKRVKAQKQEGLYTVVWHPLGGTPDPEVFCKLADTIQDMDQVEMHLAPDEDAFIVNLTAEEAQKVLDVTEENTVKTLFETTCSCIGASICQVGLRDSQELLRQMTKAVSEAGIPDGALPQMHISGCPSSCGTHQTGKMGFRGASKKTENGSSAAFMLYINGCEKQGQERMGYEAGTIEADRIPEFVVKLGKAVAASGMDFDAWYAADPSAIDKLAEEYVK